MTHEELRSLAVREGHEIFIQAIKHCQIRDYFIKVGCLCSVVHLVQDPDIPYVVGGMTDLPVKSKIGRASCRERV